MNLTKMSPALLGAFHDAIHSEEWPQAGMRVEIFFSYPLSPAEVWDLQRVHGLQVEPYAREVSTVLPLDAIGFISFLPCIGHVEIKESTLLEDSRQAPLF